MPNKGQEGMEETLAFLATPEGKRAALAVMKVNEKIRLGFATTIAQHWGDFRDALREGLGGNQDPTPQQMLSYYVAAFVLAMRPTIEEQIEPRCLTRIMKAQADAIELGAVLAIQKQALQENERRQAEKETKH